MGVVVGVGVGVGVAAIVKLAEAEVWYTSVPRPSAASTDALVKATAGAPSFKARNVTLTKLEVPVNGVGIPPPNLMIPDALEKVGSTVHNEKTEPSLVTLTTESKLGSYLRLASTAFTLCPAGTTRTVAVKV